MEGDTHAMVCRRHGDSVHKIANLLRQTVHAYNYSDAEGNPHAMSSRRLPQALTGAQPQASKPDIVVVHARPPIGALPPLASLNKATSIIILVELFHATDASLPDRRTTKHTQHAALEEQIRANGWQHVHCATIGIGHSGLLLDDLIHIAIN
jgi:hypothetical protein